MPSNHISLWTHIININTPREAFRDHTAFPAFQSSPGDEEDKWEQPKKCANARPLPGAGKLKIAADIFPLNTQSQSHVIDYGQFVAISQGSVC